MSKERHIDTLDFTYDLPNERIARYPLKERDASKLLYYRQGEIHEHSFRDLAGLLPAESWLVFNNTRVIQARLVFRKESGARIEIFCLEPLQPANYEQAFSSLGSCAWTCMVGNAKKWKDGPVYLDIEAGGSVLRLEAHRVRQEAQHFIVQFRWEGGELTFGEIMEKAGNTPIPPYLNRAAEPGDRDRYQTVYGIRKGSVAAPTAGLHFTDRMLESIRARAIACESLTLHVGAGTFVPVKAGNARTHTMHAEQVLAGIGFLERWRSRSAGPVAVGTTSTRSLESLYWLGVKIWQNAHLSPEQLTLHQWENERLPQHLSLHESLDVLLEYGRKHALDALTFSTQLMIVPGYRFRCISGLVTNFHQPGSTLLLLIAALAGDDWRRIYDFALNNDFRFLSYGDSSFLLP